MYHWITDKEFLKAMRMEGSDLLNRLVNELNSKTDLKFDMSDAGSMKRNMQLQNKDEPVDAAYNLILREAPDVHACRYIKETVRKAFNRVLHSKGWQDCSDSTSVLTTKQKSFNNDHRKTWSIDIAIICEMDNGFWYRLILKKTGIVSEDAWVWEQGPKSKDLEKKANWLKKKNYWNDVREAYKTKKNFYLSRGQTDNHPSFICYIEAVNEVYHKIR